MHGPLYPQSRGIGPPVSWVSHSLQPTPLSSCKLQSLRSVHVVRMAAFPSQSKQMSEFSVTISAFPAPAAPGRNSMKSTGFTCKSHGELLGGFLVGWFVVGVCVLCFVWLFFLVLPVTPCSVWELALFPQPGNTAESVLTWLSYHLSLFPPLMNRHIMVCYFSAVQPPSPNVSTHLRTPESTEKFI